MKSDEVVEGGKTGSDFLLFSYTWIGNIQRCHNAKINGWHCRRPITQIEINIHFILFHIKAQKSHFTLLIIKLKILPTLIFQKFGDYSNIFSLII